MTTEERKLFRLHVGGLPPNISAEDIRTRFRHFGDVLNVEIILEKFMDLIPSMLTQKIQRTIK